MTPLPLAVVVIFTIARDGTDPAVQSMMTTTSKTLRTEVHTGVGQGKPPEELGDEPNAEAVAIVEWLEPTRVSIRLRAKGGNRWIEREVSFRSGDAAKEQGRTLGFLVASLMPEAKVEATQPATPPVPPKVESTPPKEPSRSDTSAMPNAERFSRIEMDLSGQATHGAAGNAGGLGGAFGVSYLFGPNVGLRLGGSARAGNIAAAQATTLLIGIGPSLLARTQLNEEHRWGAGGRAGLLAMSQEVSHIEQSTGVNSKQAKWTLGAEVAGEGSWLFSRLVGARLAVGTEISFGSQKVFLANEVKGTLSPVRFFGQAGIFAQF